MFRQHRTEKLAIRCSSPQFESSLSFRELWNRVDLTQEKVCQEKVWVLQKQDPITWVVELLACLQSRIPVALFSPAWTDPETQIRQELLSRKVDPKTAMILFTSGSSGAPKAVQLSENNITSNIKAVIAALEFSRTDQQVLFLPLSYSFGLLGQLLPALESEITTYYYSNLSLVRELIQTDRMIGMWSGVPSHWETLLRLLPPAGRLTHQPTHLVSAGAFLTPALRTRLKNAFPDSMIYNNYGQTELSPRALCFNSRDPRFFGDGAGFAVPGLEARLTSEGELCFRGEQVMLGYIGESANIQNGWLHTGDLARMETDGLVTIQGRLDDLIKIGGERISPLEVEEALGRIDGVLGCLVTAVPDPLLGARLEAWLELRPGFEARASAFKGELSQSLSIHKIPKSYYRVPALPRTENGKILRSSIESRRASLEASPAASPDVSVTRIPE